MKAKNIAAFVAIAAALALGPTVASAVTKAVNCGSNANALATAAQAAQPGDVLQVKGICNGLLYFGSNLDYATIESAPNHTATIAGPVSAVGAVYLTISGVNITGTGMAGASSNGFAGLAIFQSSYVTYTGGTISGFDIWGGVFVSGGSLLLHSATIEHNIGKAGVFANDNGQIVIGDLDSENNPYEGSTVTENDGPGIWADSNGTITSFGNTIGDNSGPQVQATANGVVQSRGGGITSGSSPAALATAGGRIFFSPIGNATGGTIKSASFGLEATSLAAIFLRDVKLTTTSATGITILALTGGQVFLQGDNRVINTASGGTVLNAVQNSLIQQYDGSDIATAAADTITGEVKAYAQSSIWISDATVTGNTLIEEGSQLNLGSVIAPTEPVTLKGNVILSMASGGQGFTSKKHVKITGSLICNDTTSRFSVVNVTVSGKNTCESYK
jgi:hypothetical protein